jgi:hypothetical protein
MAQLSDAQKAFIVVRLACFDQPSEVAEAVKLEYGMDVTRQQVNYYNPETAEGERLSPKLKELFHATRTRFLENVQEIPIANQSYRLRELQKLYHANPRNAVLRADLLEQAAKEAGGAFTNKIQIIQQLARDVAKLSDADLLALLGGNGTPPTVLPSGSPAPGLVATNGNGKHEQ